MLILRMFKYMDQLITGGIGILSILFSLVIFQWVRSLSTGEGKQVVISNLIKVASFVYLRKQYTVIWVVVGCLFFLMCKIFSLWAGSCFLIGALTTSFVGYYNMTVSVNANVRTTEAAKSGLSKAFKVAMLAGSSASLFLNGLGILTIILVIYITSLNYSLFNLSSNLVALSIGVNVVAVFARLGGGVFTKGADVGADMVGKIEQSLPEDSPQNPAVIADNVGDNVGDCSGMSADLFESYIISISASIILNSHLSVYLPLEVCALGIVSSIIPLFLMKFKNVWLDMERYFLTCLGFFLTAIFALYSFKFMNSKQALCVMVGSLTVGLLLKITEYYTSTDHSPVRNVAEASGFGHGTNIIYGLAYGYESVFLPILIVVISIFICYYFGDIRGISFGVLGITALSPAILTLDIFGPISDNAGGIAEISGLPESVRAVTDELDAVGNTTKAITKGYAIGSAIFSAIVIFFLFQSDLIQLKGINLSIYLTSPILLCGLLIGGIIPCLFSGMSMLSVGQAASVVVQDVRAQFQANPEILTGNQAPDYERTISYLTDFSIKAMILPALLPIFIPLFGFISAFYFTGTFMAFNFLGAILLGVTLLGSILSIFMVTAGGLWDNTKKYLEQTLSKKSDSYKAAVTGDTVGDPFKDTTGPSLNSVIKLANLIGILIVHLF